MEDIPLFSLLTFEEVNVVMFYDPLFDPDIYEQTSLALSRKIRGLWKAMDFTWAFRWINILI